MSKAVADTLRRARAKIEEGWCQGSSARDAIGSRVDPLSIYAVQWCTVGAIEAVCRTYTLSLESRAALRRIAPEELVDFNDHRRRTKEDILDLYHQAIAANEAIVDGEPAPYRDAER